MAEDIKERIRRIYGAHRQSNMACSLHNCLTTKVRFFLVWTCGCSMFGRVMGLVPKYSVLHAVPSVRIPFRSWCDNVVHYVHQAVFILSGTQPSWKWRLFKISSCLFQFEFGSNHLIVAQIAYELFLLKEKFSLSQAGDAVYSLQKLWVSLVFAHSNFWILIYVYLF